MDRRTLRRTIATITSAALLASLGVAGGGVPAAAVDEATAIYLNGIPGLKIDICSGGKEIASNIPYGGSRTRQLAAPDQHTLTARKARRGKCNGGKLATLSRQLEANESHTFVVWRPVKRTLIKHYRNNLALADPTQATLRLHHVAAIGPSDWWVYSATAPAATDTRPTVDKLRRGQRSAIFEMAARPTIVAAVPDAASRRWNFAQNFRSLDQSKVYLAFLLGKAQKNMRVKIVGQPAQTP